MNNNIKIFNLALKNIMKHPGKNILVGIMVFLATFIFLFTASLSERCIMEWRKFYSETDLGYYNVTEYFGLKKDNTAPSFDFPKKFISPQIINYLETNNLYFTKRIRTGGVKYNFEKQEFDGGKLPNNIIGTDVEKELKILNNLGIVEGKYDKNIENGALVWKGLMTKYKLKIGDEISYFVRDIDNNTVPLSFIITGVIYNKSGDNMESQADVPMHPLVFVSYDYFSAMLGVEEGQCTEVSIWDKNKTHIANIKNLALKTKSEFYYAEGGYGIIGGITSFLKFIGNFIGIFILVVLLISTFNINLMGFIERQREIGVMAAMGAKPKWIIKLLSYEMFFFGIASFILSVVMYVGIQNIFAGGINLGDVNVAFAGKNLILSIVWPTVVTTFVTIIAAMFLSTIYPIYLTTKINPVEIFREGEM